MLINQDFEKETMNFYISKASQDADITVKIIKDNIDIFK